MCWEVQAVVFLILVLLILGESILRHPVALSPQYNRVLLFLHIVRSRLSRSSSRCSPCLPSTSRRRLLEGSSFEETSGSFVYSCQLRMQHHRYRVCILCGRAHSYHVQYVIFHVPGCPSHRRLRAKGSASPATPTEDVCARE